MILLSQNKNIILLYLIFIVSILMNFVPSIIIQSWGGILFLISFIATYIAKFGADKDSFQHAHYSYIIKTVWIFSFFSFFGILAAYFFGDHSIIHSLTADVQSGIIPTNDKIIDTLIEYGTHNIVLFLTLFVPIILYALYRLGKGLLLARNNQTPSLKSWI